jgi:hypothetical protein
MPRPDPVLLSIAILSIGTACAPKPAFKPVATVKQLMQSTIDPAAEVLFDAVGTVITVNGEEEIAPKDDEEWATVQRNALTLAEAGNLLMIGDRVKDRGEWMKMARALVDVGVVAMKAAEAKNPEALFEAGGQVYAACQQCHDKYWTEGASRVQ